MACLIYVEQEVCDIIIINIVVYMLLL